MAIQVIEKNSSARRLTRIGRDLKLNACVYLLALPVIAYYVIFCYVPMYGAVIAFKNYSPGLGILGSPWVGLKHFIDFFSSNYFWRLIRNTVFISLGSLVFAFPAPILLAIGINEIKSRRFKNFTQTISYLPHFVSTVIICGMIVNYTSTDGLINSIITMLGGKATNMLSRPELFRSIFIGSNIWTDLGWSSIIFLAALASIDVEQYEAALIDGAGRIKRIWHITLPGIRPVIIIMLVLAIGNFLNVGWEKIILLYNPLTYETADVISTYVYRRGIESGDFSYSTAIGLFNSAFNFLLLIGANYFSKKISETGLW